MSKVVRQLTVSTRHFRFSVLIDDDNISRGVHLLEQGWHRHCEEYPRSDRDLMRELIDNGDIEVKTWTPGVVLRDGEPIYRDESREV
jgi:hypothetical protein